MKLLGVHLSPFVRKVSVVLTAKALDYEQEVIMPGSDDAGFRELSPLGKIPVLVDHGQAIPDSSVICEYLEEKYPQHPMLPATPELRAQARFMEEFGDSKLVEACGIIFVQRFANPNIFGKPADEARIETAINDLLPPLLDYLEGRVPDEGFLFGELCTADVSVFTPLINARYGGYTLDAQRWPRYAAYANRVEQHPAVQSVMATEKQALEAMMAG